ncbi:cytochrome c oxidase assembly protein [Deinococcus pimensis]|uniref:cytochrome c oxidase assembly protein n=1 Tax=Deinococcus pimensis TaxID=309888 RepID=UPI0004B77AD9|nr:cytochrome c oxidase assembly protein [Deinococcus pimensis]
MDLNPSAATLLFSWRFDGLVWGAAALALAVYLWRFVAARRDAARRALWSPWRAASFVAGVLVALLALQSSASSYTLNSMALYMGRLMLLAELAPPLIVLGLPSALIRLSARGLAGRVLGFLLDPYVAFALWTAIIVFWNLPAGLSASVVGATSATLLPLLYLGGGLLVWAVTLNSLPGVRSLAVGTRGWFGFLNGLPMMGVAAVWLYSPKVLYSPFVNVPCLWNLTPLQNQQISGLVMMVAGVPALALALVQMFVWLSRLAESSGVVVDEGEGV